MLSIVKLHHRRIQVKTIEMKEFELFICCLFLAQKCSFRKAMIPGTLSTLHQLITIDVCPVNWQILDQYENTQEFINNVHTTQCQLPGNHVIEQTDK